MSLGLPREPRFEYGPDPTVVTLAYPQRPWSFRPRTTGNTETTGSGYRVGYRVRHDKLLVVRLRFPMSQWSAVEAMIEYGQLHPNTLTYYPDKDDLATAFVCYLEAPQLGEEWEPPREDSPDVFGDFEIILDKVDKVPWDIAYFDV